jgi:protein-S-isoprenylcysteine O-methyltransferase Ste14
MFDLPLVAVFSWIVYGVYWVLSARTVKKDSQRQKKWWDSLAARLIIILLVALFPWYRIFGTRAGSLFLPANTLPRSIVGFVLCEFGIACAVWARWHLGRNWSPSPSVKEGHELVTSGPYAFVRHPIYTGILTGLLGTSILCGIQWILVASFVAVAFIARIPSEEALMSQQFPDKYLEYKTGTKRLIPLIW